MKILSPVVTGSGVEVVHGALAEALPGYRLRRYSPYWSLLPPALPLIGRGAADIVHAAADYGVWFARHDVPLVVTVHNYTSDRAMRDYSSRLQYLHYRTDLRAFTRWTLACASTVVAISEFIGSVMRDDLDTDVPIRTIYNGVDHTRFLPTSQPRDRDSFRVLFCGNLNRRKRAHLLPALAAALDSAFEIHYTAGLSDTMLRDAGKRSGGARLIPLGRIKHGDMPGIYQSMDALFMPSVREGFGLCVAEAMACGLPVVACRESAMPELVDVPHGGMLCDVDDVPGFAEALLTLADDPARAAGMGQFNRARVESQFTLTRMVDDYRELFEELLDKRTSR